MALPTFSPLLWAADSSEARARQFIAGLRSTEKIPAVCATVAKVGSIVWSEALGESDLEDGATASTRTRYRIGSLSKLITAAAAARLYDQGLLDLDAPIQKYVPTFPASGITVKLLLGHLAGLRHYGAGEYLNQKRYSSVAETLAVFQNSPLLQPPGAKYFYSSYGFNLLGAALERAGSQDFGTLIQRQVCDPLRLQFTIPEDNTKVVVGRSRYYSLTNGQVENAPYTDLSDRWPSGGFLSTTEDLARFGVAHLAGEFFRPDTLRMMFTSQRTVEGVETGVGFGWRIGVLDNRRIYHHGGDAIGGRAFLLLRPEGSIVVALVGNLGFARFAERQAMELADLFV